MISDADQARSQTYRVVTGSGTDIGLTRGERVVVVHVDAGHDESTTHDVELATKSEQEHCVNHPCSPEYRCALDPFRLTART